MEYGPQRALLHGPIIELYLIGIFSQFLGTEKKEQTELIRTTYKVHFSVTCSTRYDLKTTGTRRTGKVFLSFPFLILKESTIVCPIKIIKKTYENTSSTLQSDTTL